MLAPNDDKTKDQRRRRGGLRRSRMPIEPYQVGVVIAASFLPC